MEREAYRVSRIAYLAEKRVLKENGRVVRQGNHKGLRDSQQPHRERQLWLLMGGCRYIGLSLHRTTEESPFGRDKKSDLALGAQGRL